MVTTHLITATELESMGSDAPFELIQGVLYEMSPSGYDSSEIGMTLGIILGTYAFEHNLGTFSGENGGYLLEHNPDSLVAPDIGFVKRERRGLRPARGKPFPGAPDLAIEVLSPSDEAGDIRRKKALYERVGVPMVWWIDPIRRTATVQRAGRPVQQLTEFDSLDGEDIVPGFSLQLTRLFDF
jgi:Uma2 family endonuclease